MLWAPRKEFPCLGPDAVQAHICSSGIILAFVSITRGWRHRATVFLFLDWIIHNSLQKKHRRKSNLWFLLYLHFEQFYMWGRDWLILDNLDVLAIHREFNFSYFLIFPRASDRDSCIAFGVVFFCTVCSKGNEDGTWLEWSCPNYKSSGVVLYGKHHHSQL